MSTFADLTNICAESPVAVCQCVYLGVGSGNISDGDTSGIRYGSFWFSGLILTPIYLLLPFANVYIKFITVACSF